MSRTPPGNGRPQCGPIQLSPQGGASRPLVTSSPRRYSTPTAAGGRRCWDADGEYDQRDDSRGTWRTRAGSCRRRSTGRTPPPRSPRRRARGSSAAAPPRTARRRRRAAWQSRAARAPPRPRAQLEPVHEAEQRRAREQPARAPVPEDHGGEADVAASSRLALQVAELPRVEGLQRRAAQAGHAPDTTTPMYL